MRIKFLFSKGNNHVWVELTENPHNRRTLHQLYFRLGADAQNLQSNADIKYQGNKSANQQMDKWNEKKKKPNKQFLKEEIQMVNNHFKRCSIFLAN